MSGHSTHSAPVLSMRQFVRFLRRIAIVGDCWERQGYRTDGGYTTISLIRDGIQRCLYAHRVSYEFFVGPIPDGMEVDHLCRNRACVNPEHFEIVTSAVNTLRGFGPTAENARRTHCKQGHTYDDLNTYFDKRGRRYCRECKRKEHRDRMRVRRANGEKV